ncbi:MAG: Rid family detoxifying hydrolase, partial [Myxococcota bacterium]
MDRRREIRTEHAPAPVGPYSQAIAHAGVLYASGQIPLDPETGKLVTGEIEAQTEQVLANLAAVVAAAGASMDDVLRATIYLTDLSLFPRVNEVYGKAFSAGPTPARATV